MHISGGFQTKKAFIFMHVLCGNIQSFLVLSLTMRICSLKVLSDLKGLLSTSFLIKIIDLRILDQWIIFFSFRKSES